MSLRLERFPATACLAAGLVLGACTGASLPRGYLARATDLVGTVEADPPVVLRAAEQLLREEWGFVAASVDADRGTLATDTLRVGPSWRDSPRSEFVFCDSSDGQPPASADEDARVVIRLVTRQQDVGATLVRIDVEGTLAGPESGGRTLDCRPTRRLARELLAGLRAAVRSP